MIVRAPIKYFCDCGAAHNGRRPVCWTCWNLLPADIRTAIQRWRGYGESDPRHLQAKQDAHRFLQGRRDQLAARPGCGGNRCAHPHSTERTCCDCGTIGGFICRDCGFTFCTSAGCPSAAVQHSCHPIGQR